MEEIKVKVVEEVKQDGGTFFIYKGRDLMGCTIYPLGNEEAREKALQDAKNQAIRIKEFKEQPSQVVFEV